MATLDALTSFQRDMVSLEPVKRVQALTTLDDQGLSPIHYAISANNIDFIDYAMQGLSADQRKDVMSVVTKDGTPPMNFAAANLVYPDTIHALKDYGADINAKDKDGNTALHIAAKSNFPEVVTTLLEEGADKAITNNDKLTPYELAQKEFTEKAGKNQAYTSQWQYATSQMRKNFENTQPISREPRKVEVSSLTTPPVEQPATPKQEQKEKASETPAPAEQAAPVDKQQDNAPATEPSAAAKPMTEDELKQKTNQLHEAILYGKTTEVQDMLGGISEDERKKLLEAQNAKGLDATKLAILHNNPEMLKLLAAFGAPTEGLEAFITGTYQENDSARPALLGALQHGQQYNKNLQQALKGEDLGAVLAAMDTNGDKAVGTDEWNTALQSNPQLKKWIVEKMDANKDGKLTNDEMQAGVQASIDHGLSLEGTNGRESFTMDFAVKSIRGMIKDGSILADSNGDLLVSSDEPNHGLNAQHFPRNSERNV